MNLKMRSGPVAVAAIAAAVILATADICQACGVWTLHDAERGRAYFMVHNVALGSRLLFTVWWKAPHLRAVDTGGEQVKSPRGHRTTFDFDGETIRYLGQPIGILDGSLLRIAKKQFTVEIAPVNGKRIERAQIWTIKVRQGDRLIAHSRAAYLICEATVPDLMLQKLAIAQRVGLYIGWRTVIAPRSSSPRSSSQPTQ